MVQSLKQEQNTHRGIRSKTDCALTHGQQIRETPRFVAVQGMEFNTFNQKNTQEKN